MNSNTHHYALVLACLFPFAGRLNGQDVKTIASAAPLSTELLAQEKAVPEGELEPKLWEGVGGLAGISSYACIQYIGTIAAGYAAGTCDRITVATRMGALSGGLKVNIKQIEALAGDASIIAADRATMKRTLSILNSLVSMADSLKHYALNGKPEHLKSFHDLRTKTWTSVSSFLSLPEDITKKLTPDGANLGRSASSPRPGR